MRKYTALLGLLSACAGSGPMTDSDTGDDPAVTPTSPYGGGALIEAVYAGCSGVRSASISVSTTIDADFGHVWVVGTSDSLASTTLNPEPHAEDHMLDYLGPADGVDLWSRSFSLELGVTQWEPDVTTSFRCIDGTDTSRWGYPTVGEFGDPSEATYVVRLYRGSDLAACAVFGHAPDELMRSITWRNWDAKKDDPEDEPTYRPDLTPEDYSDYPALCEVR